MPIFGWISERGAIAPRWDLRRAGWKLCHSWQSGCCLCGHIELVELEVAAGLVTLPRTAADYARKRLILLGVDKAKSRAGLMDQGFGEVLSQDVGLPELAARASRLAALLNALPRKLKAAGLTLDLMHRDAQFGGQWVNLLPREFELLWFLAERSGQRVTRGQLLKDVWRLNYEPETNSVEVHISRLRAKLARKSSQQFIQTDPAGGYRFIDHRPFMLGKREGETESYLSQSPHSVLDRPQETRKKIAR